MSLTERAIARYRAQETSSISTTSISILAVALLGGTIAAGYIDLYKKAKSYQINEVPSVQAHIAKIVTWTDREGYVQSRTPLGRKLFAIRNRAISKGLLLLDAEKITSEISLRRGELFSV